MEINSSGCWFFSSPCACWFFFSARIASVPPLALWQLSFYNASWLNSSPTSLKKSCFNSNWNPFSILIEILFQFNFHSFSIWISSCLFIMHMVARILNGFYFQFKAIDLLPLIAMNMPPTLTISFFFNLLSIYNVMHMQFSLSKA